MTDWSPTLAFKMTEADRLAQDVLDDHCDSCGYPGCHEGECPKSLRPCGHHCNHSWSHDVCCWCRVEFGENGVEIWPEGVRPKEPS